MAVQPYLIFNGLCEEALDFYKKAVGAKVEMMMRFGESPEPSPPGCAPADSNKIMHSCIRIGDAAVMASDGMTMNGQPKFEGISLSLSVETADEADRMFKGLSDGGKVTMPLSKTFFSDRFGMVEDRFGVSWLVLVAQ